MGKRRNPHRNDPTPTYYGAFGSIAKLEAAVIRNTVECNFTMEDVAKWMLPDEQIAALKAAYEFTHFADRTDLHTTLNLPGFSCSVFFRCTTIGMLRPHISVDGRVPTRVEIIGETITRVRAVHQQFEQVRRVVQWLDRYATLNAAKYYFPVVGSLLPAGHPYHDLTGTMYGEPKADMTKVIPVMRECSETVAGALLCNREYTKQDAGFAVSFGGRREQLDGNGAESYSSQGFALI